ncbi:MAG: hypothetical protein ABIS50_07695 [Luteolibacter sp.]|uniref:hypothetical protein n=1 Tax=Luteolibacter sp. TaxID=1962973 RepID=UPI0032664B57
MKPTSLSIRLAPASTATGLLLAILASPLAFAQTVDRSTGTVLDSSASPSVPPNPNPPPRKLVAVLHTIVPDSKPSGDLSFSISGDAINVNGRVEGLEPGKSYQLVMPLPEDNPVSGNPAAAAEPPSEAGPPDSGQPHAGAPSALPPAAGTPDAGKPDGELRPGAPGHGEGTSVTGNRPLKKPAADTPTPGSDRILQSFTADTNGSSNVSATLRIPASDAGLDSILGRTLLLMRPAQGDQTEPSLIATGTVTAPDMKRTIPVETPPPNR